MGGTSDPSRQAEIQLKQLRLKFVETGWVRFISPKTTHFGGGHVFSQSSQTRVLFYLGGEF
jgi:hypothetical protein